MDRGALGPRTLYHVSPAANRDSIAAHGLDPRRMGVARGIAGSERRELDGVFVCHDLDEVAWFADMGMRQTEAAVDVWAIDDPGSVLQTNTSGYEYLPVPVPPERVRLLETRTASSAPEPPDAPELSGELWAVIGSPEEVAAQLEELGEGGLFAYGFEELQQSPREHDPPPPELANDLALVLRAVDGTLHPPCASDHPHAAVAELRDGEAWWVCPADGRPLAPLGAYGR